MLDFAKIQFNSLLPLFSAVFLLLININFLKLRVRVAEGPGEIESREA